MPRFHWERFDWGRQLGVATKLGGIRFAVRHSVHPLHRASMRIKALLVLQLKAHGKRHFGKLRYRVRTALRSNGIVVRTRPRRRH